MLRRILVGLPEPAYLTGQRWDRLGWNEAAAELFRDSAARHGFRDAWSEEARRMVSLFRAAHDLWPGDPAFADLVDRLRASGPEFDAWWFGIGAPLSGTKCLRHPPRGLVCTAYASFQVNDDPAIELALYTQV